MKKKFIQKSDLGEIMETLAERAMAHGEKIDLSMSISGFLGESTLTVSMRDARSFKLLKKQTYIIIDELETWDDILDDTIGDAVILWEREQANVQAEAEQNNNDETSNN